MADVLSKEKDNRILGELIECVGQRLEPDRIREIFNKEDLNQPKVEFCKREKYDYSIYHRNDRNTIFHLKTLDDRTIIDAWIAGTR